MCVWCGRIMTENYYDLLNVSCTASPEGIRKAYRETVKKHHPDRNGNSKESHQKFLQIRAAYETLSNPIEREKYDSRKTTRSDSKNNNASDLEKKIESAFRKVLNPHRWSLAHSIHNLGKTTCVDRRRTLTSTLAFMEFQSEVTSIAFEVYTEVVNNPKIYSFDFSEIVKLSLKKQIDDLFFAVCGLKGMGSSSDRELSAGVGKLTNIIYTIVADSIHQGYNQSKKY